MEIIEIEVSKNQNGIVVTSSDTRKIEIANEDKELKAIIEKINNSSEV